MLVLLDDALVETGMRPVLCLPLTSKLFTQMTALRVALPPRGRLLKTRYVMPEQARVLDRDRFGEGPLALVTEHEMRDSEQLFATVAGFGRRLDPAH